MINFFEEQERSYPLFRKLSEREKYLLRENYVNDLSTMESSMINECENQVFSREQIFELDSVEKKKIFSHICETYKIQVRNFCNSLPKSVTPTCNIITGPPGAGKSKIISREIDKAKFFPADADYIKKVIAERMNVNINSPKLHEISSNLRNKALDMAAECGCNIIVEKIGDNAQSLLSTIERINSQSEVDYKFNLYSVHCRESISRIRNAIRFQKYDTPGKAGRFVEDSRIVQMGAGPIETYFDIVTSDQLSEKFDEKKSYICETIFEGSQTHELINLNHTKQTKIKDADEKFLEIKDYVFEFVCRFLSDQGIIDIRQAHILTHIALCKIYDTTTKQNNNRLYNIEQGKVRELTDCLSEILSDEKTLIEAKKVDDALPENY